MFTGGTERHQWHELGSTKRIFTLQTTVFHDVSYSLYNFLFVRIPSYLEREKDQWHVCHDYH